VCDAAVVFDTQRFLGMDGWLCHERWVFLILLLFAILTNAYSSALCPSYLKGYNGP
jgi:hypothetical protein